MTVYFGINLNNREPLLASHYTLSDLLDLAQIAENYGFHSVWVGDSLFSKPRYDPLILLGAISQLTKRIVLGTACLVTATRNPLYLAMQWATLDRLSGGRTVMGACMSNPEEGVRREYQALGLDYGRRAEIFEEGLQILRQLLTTGKVTFRGTHFVYDNIEFYSGTEIEPLTPLQKPPPIWVVSNPTILGRSASVSKTQAVLSRAAHRIARFGDGWLTCCRAAHPEDFIAQRQLVVKALQEHGRNPAGFPMAYQVTLNVAEDPHEAERDLASYIENYYPELTSKGAVDLRDWGPVGTPEQVAGWFRLYANLGANYFICRFASMDQFAQVRRFAEMVLPALKGLTSSSS